MALEKMTTKQQASHLFYIAKSFINNYSQTKQCVQIESVANPFLHGGYLYKTAVLHQTKLTHPVR